jgi:hypothetical protein
MEEATYWRGKPCVARRVCVLVHISDPEYGGTMRRAVEVCAGAEAIFLDDESGLGWQVITVGLGADAVFHVRHLRIAKLVEPGAACPQGCAAKCPCAQQRFCAGA